MLGREAGGSLQRSSSSHCRAGGGAAGARPGRCPAARGRERRGGAAQSSAQNRGLPGAASARLMGEAAAAHWAAGKFGKARAAGEGVGKEGEGEGKRGKREGWKRERRRHGALSALARSLAVLPGPRVP